MRPDFQTSGFGEPPSPDRVELRDGVVHLPQLFRDIARLANQAGLGGLEVADVKIGMDIEAARRGDLRSWATITYRERST